MNKGFEVIEACWLFDFSPDDVEVVVHPQSTRARDGGIQRRQRDCAGLGDGYAHADSVRADLSGARTGAGAEDRLERGPASGNFTRPISSKFPLLSLAYQGAARPAARRRAF